MCSESQLSFGYLKRKNFQSIHIPILFSQSGRQSPEYTFDQFCEIARRLLSKRFGHSNQVADGIATAVWNEMHSKDIRNVLSIAKLVHSIDDVLWLIQTYKKYGKIHGRMETLVNGF